MKRKLSLNKLLHNEKVILIFSLLAAIGIWFSVVYGPSNVIERTIKVSVDVSLNHAYAKDNNLRIMTRTEEVGSVLVKGPRSVVDRLTADSLSLKADTASVVQSGKVKVDVKAAKSGAEANYEIKDFSPKFSEFTCDYWKTASLPVTADIAVLSVSDKSKYQLGIPVVESAALVDGTVNLEGPKTQLDKVASVVARVDTPKVMSEVQVFPTKLVALDKEGAEAAIPDCTFMMPAGTPVNVPVNVTVPVLIHQKVTFQYALAHVPEAYKDRPDFFKLTPSFVELWGTPQEVEAFSARISNLGVFDFDNISQNTMSKIIPLTIPAGVKILDETVTSIKAAFNLNGITSQTRTLTFNTSNLTIINKPEGRTVKPSQPKLTDIQICGPSSALRQIRDGDLQVTVDMKGIDTVGPALYEARVTIKGRNNVWVYYGYNGEHGLEMWLTIE